MARFPLFIDLSGRKCMIFGGGKVASRKIEILLRYGAQIEVISKDVVPEIREMVPPGNIHLAELSPGEAGTSAADFQGTSLESRIRQADIVIAATSDRQVNHEIGCICDRNHIPVNVIDAPEECFFLFPSVVKRGEISIGINTDGRSPVVSKRVRQDIERAIPDYYGEIADQLGDVKEYVKESFSSEKRRRSILKQVAEKAFTLKRPLTEEELDTVFRT